MNNSGAGRLQKTRYEPWLQSTYIFVRENATPSNLIGLLAALCALFLFVALPTPWNIRLPLYLVIFIWTVLRPRVALYLMPFAVPWGSLDIINVAGLHLNSADILVVFLAVGWLMSFALRPTLIHSKRVGAGAGWSGEQGPWALVAARQEPLTDHKWKRELQGPPPGTHSSLAPTRTHLPHHKPIPEREVGARDREASNVPDYLIFAILALLATMLLSITAAINISSSLKEISKWLEFLVLILLGARYLRTRRQIWTIIILVCLAGITQAFYGYFQAFFNLGPEAFIRDTSLRVYGTFDQPNPYAGYINIPLSIAVALMLLGSNWIIRMWAGLTAILLAAAEYLTQSRGGEIAIAVSLLFIVIVGMPRIRKPLAIAALAGLALVEVFFTGWIPTYALNPVLKNLGLVQISFVKPSTADYSTAERLAHWIAGVRMFLDHPLFGTGIGNYPDAYPKYYITIFVNSLGHAHNYYINIAAETGSVGLTAYLLFLLAMFVAGGSAYQAINKRYRQAKAQTLLAQPKAAVPFGTKNKLAFLLQSLNFIAPPPGTFHLSASCKGETGAVTQHVATPLVGVAQGAGGEATQHVATPLVGVARVERGAINRSPMIATSFPTIITKNGNPLWVQRIYTASDLLRNDRALAIGLLAALLSVCAHNLVDDLYVHSLTNLIALLLIVLIRIEGSDDKRSRYWRII